IVCAGGLDVAADGSEPSIALAPRRRERIEQRVTAPDEIRHLLCFLSAPGGLMAAVHPAAEERHVRQMNPTQGVKRAADDQSKNVRAEKAKAKREQSQDRVVRASKK